MYSLEDCENDVKMYRFYSGAKTVIPVKIEALWMLTNVAVRRIVCRVFGHDFEDHSTAGPETGNVTICCKRCDFFHYEVLY